MLVCNKLIWYLTSHWVSFVAHDIVQSPIAHRLHYVIIVIGFQYQINQCMIYIVMVICYIAINHCVVCPVVTLHSQLCTVTCNGWVQNCSPKLAWNFFWMHRQTSFFGQARYCNLKITTNLQTCLHVLTVLNTTIITNGTF